MLGKLLVTSLWVLCFALTAHAQICADNIPGECSTPDTGYSFGQAKAHSHDTPLSNVTGFYCGRGIAPDSTNNTGNIFFGNLICINSWPDGPQWFWYDWSADEDAVLKVSIWHLPFQWVTADYDPTCGLAVTAFDPWQ